MAVSALVTVRLDGGGTRDCLGREFGRIDSADYP